MVYTLGFRLILIIRTNFNVSSSALLWAGDF